MNDIFVLILTACINSQCDAYVEDTNLSLDDCKAAIVSESTSHKLTTSSYLSLASTNRYNEGELNTLTHTLQCTLEDFE